MSAKHDGCADYGQNTACTGGFDEILTSVLAPMINPTTKKSISPNKAVCKELKA
jgi:hypothetical protein